MRTLRAAVDIIGIEDFTSVTGKAISPRGDMPKNRVLNTKGAACLIHTPRLPQTSFPD
jgi:hypothetical protein